MASAEEVLRRVRSVPRGRVTTYGDLSPGAPRFAGAVLSECHDASVPWHRVVRADGSLAKGDRQRRLLEAEGGPFRGERGDMGAGRLPDLGGAVGGGGGGAGGGVGGGGGRRWGGGERGGRERRAEGGKGDEGRGRRGSL